MFIPVVTSSKIVNEGKNRFNMAESLLIYLGKHISQSKTVKKIVKVYIVSESLSNRTYYIFVAGTNKPGLRRHTAIFSECIILELLALLLLRIIIIIITYY